MEAMQICSNLRLLQPQIHLREAIPDFLLLLTHFEGFGIDTWQMVSIDQHA